MRKSIETRLDSGKYLPYARLPEYGWEEHGYRVVHAGDVISPKYGEHWVCLSGHVTVRNQTGGNFQARGSSRQTISGQKGGQWEACDTSRQTVSGQEGGYWTAHGNSRQTISGQKDGGWDAWGKSRQIVSGQKGGGWGAWENSRQKILDKEKENPDA